MLMKGIWIVWVVLLAGLLACNNDEEAVIVPGTYTGEFNRYSPGSPLISSHVSITLDQNTFTGSSDAPKSPAICSGSYKLTGSEIEFSNHCPWTAEFDWTYILGGKFKVKVMNDEMILVRMYDNQVTDLYRLQRQ